MKIIPSFWGGHNKDIENPYLQKEVSQKIEQLKNYIIAIKSSI